MTDIPNATPSDATAPPAEAEVQETLDAAVEEAVKYLLQQAASRAVFHGD